jgi:hypothetical protein
MEPASTIWGWRKAANKIGYRGCTLQWRARRSRAATLQLQALPAAGPPVSAAAKGRYTLLSPSRASGTGTARRPPQGAHQAGARCAASVGAGQRFHCRGNVAGAGACAEVARAVARQLLAGKGRVWERLRAGGRRACTAVASGGGAASWGLPRPQQPARGCCPRVLVVVCGRALHIIAGVRCRRKAAASDLVEWHACQRERACESACRNGPAAMTAAAPELVAGIEGAVSL